MLGGEEEKPRRASSGSWIERSGLIPLPLQMSPGAAVIGRVVREGKPVSGVTVGLGESMPNSRCITHSWWITRIGNYEVQV